MDIKIKQISKSYGNQQVLKGFTCRCPQGKITCIMGPSGVGKSTLMNLMLGLQKPDSGTIEGVPQGHLAAVFQEDRLCENLSALGNIKMVCSSKDKQEKKKQELEIREAMRQLQLEDAFGKPVRELSGGMRRRVAILRALKAEAQCIVMDEPFKGLDEKTKEQTIAYVKAQCVGKTLLVITHDSQEADLLGAVQVIQMKKCKQEK